MLLAVALVELARSQWVEDVPVLTRCWPVMVQQLMFMKNIAVAGGLLAVGSRFVGTTEDCGALLERMLSGGADQAATAAALVDEHRRAGKPMPGFGHPLHKPDDPRARWPGSRARAIAASTRLRQRWPQTAATSPSTAAPSPANTG